MRNKRIEKLLDELAVKVWKMEDTLSKTTKEARVFNTVDEVSPFPAMELKEGCAELRAVPQMPEEKQKLVKMLSEHLEFVLDRAHAVELGSSDAKIICELSKVLADLVG